MKAKGFLIMKEIWLDVVGYEKLYLISNFGNVKNYNTGRLKTKILINSGYLCVKLYKNNRQKNHLIHRLVAEAFIPNSKSLETVNHIDYCKTNNRVSNLEWSSYFDNMKHAYDNNLICHKGTKNGRAKLKDMQIYDILTLSKSNSNAYIAKLYNVDPSTISNIVNRKSWKHINKTIIDGEID